MAVISAALLTKLDSKMIIAEKIVQDNPQAVA